MFTATLPLPQERIFPVFAVVATKFKKMPNMPRVLEMALSAEGQTNRLKQPQGRDRERNPYASTRRKKIWKRV